MGFTTSSSEASWSEKASVARDITVRFSVVFGMLPSDCLIIMFIIKSISTDLVACCN